MAGDSAHGKLVNEALAHWGAGRLAEALDCYTAAIEACPQSHWALFDYYGGRAGVLVELGRNDEARREYERLLAYARQSGEGDEDSNVGLARYLVGNHHVSRGAFDEALDVVAPSITAGARQQALLRTVQAMALHGLGREVEARESAKAAMAAASGERQAANIRTQLATLLDEGRG